MTAQLPSISDETKRTRNAWRILIVLLIALLAFNISSIADLLRERTSLQFLSVGVTFGATLATLGSAWLTWRKRVTAAMWVLIGQILVPLSLAVFLTRGLGLVYAFMGLIMVSGIASLTLPAAKQGRAWLVAVVVGIGVVLADLLGPTTRPLAGNTNFTLVMLTVLGSVFLALQWRSLVATIRRLAYPQKFILISLLFVLPLATFYPLVDSHATRYSHIG